MKKSSSGGGVIINKLGQVLVVSQHGNSWSLPKGTLEEGENARTAAVREIQEETGITELNFIKELGSYERYMIGKNGGEFKGHLKNLTFFLYTTDEMELAPIDPDNPEARWVELSEVSQLLTHPKDKAFFNRVFPEVKKFIKSEKF
jgi:ADP-ribose pyrophosphatase YjhB (NUDIX family)